jgi:hypothetical protein
VADADISDQKFYGPYLACADRMYTGGCSPGCMKNCDFVTGKELD